MKAHNECGADRPATAAMCFCHSAQERPPPKEKDAGRRIEMNVRPIWSGKKKKEIPSKITYIYGHKQHKGIHQQQQQHRLADDALILCLIYLADVGPCFFHLFLYSI